jgi:hypothetical protein
VLHAADRRANEASGQSPAASSEVVVKIHAGDQSAMSLVSYRSESSLTGMLAPHIKTP